MSKILTARAESLLKDNTRDFVLNKLISEKTARQSLTNIHKAIKQAEENLQKV